MAILNPNTIIDESWEAYRSFQFTKNVIEKLHDECSDTYPMILFPSKLSQTLMNFVDENQSMRVSNMIELITEHGRDAEHQKKEWDLYKQKPSKPLLYTPEKKTAVKKTVDAYYPTEKEDNYRPAGSLIVYLIILAFFIYIAYSNSDGLGWLFLITTVIPVITWLFIQIPETFFTKETKYIHRKKKPKQIEKEEKEAEDEYRKQLAECEKWNANEWPKLVAEAEQEYKKYLEEYEKSMPDWEKYWKSVPSFIESEYPVALKHFIWGNINFQVVYNEEENPRRGAMEDQFLTTLKKIGVEKLKRDISIDDCYPDFSIIDDYYFVDIEIDEPYKNETGEPIHYKGCGDEEINDKFQNLGVFVLRFTEDQIIKSMATCADIILHFQKFLETGDITFLKEVVEKSEKIRQKRWTYSKAKIMADYRYRDK